MNKKILSFLLLLILPITIIKAADLDTVFKETEFAYYRNSINSQYSSARNEYYDPAEATSQDTKFSVCSRYTSNVYKNAFNISIPGNTNALMKFVDANYKDSNYKKYIIDYHDCVSNSKGKGSCNTMTESQYNNLISKLKPGDVLVYTKGSIEKGSGHALIIYDTLTNSSGQKDAYILNSTGGSVVYTRNLGTNRVFYNYRTVQDTGINKTVHKSVKEGTVKMERFRADAKFAFTSASQAYGVVGSNKYRIAIIRFIVDNKYPIYDATSYKVKEEKTLSLANTNGYLRTKYKDLSITKTVNAVDNNVVVLGQELVYTLKIKNDSSTAYGKFYIQEAVSNSKYATVTEASGGTLNGNTINYEIPSLAAGETKTITYKVKVTDNITYLGNTITSSGKFSNTSDFKLSLKTGTVKNKIDNKLTDDNKAAIKNAYNNLKGSKTGLDLINETYKTALNIDLDLTNFKLTSLIKEDVTKINTCKEKGLLGRNCQDAFSLASYKIGSTNYTYKDMILNNYWNGLVNQDSTPNDDTIDFNSNKPQKEKNMYTWNGSGDSSKRAKSIIGSHFEDGDILIYYNSNDFIDGDNTDSANRISYEDGLYAYIYLDGKFVGVNGSSYKQRNEFTTKYYLEDHTGLSWYSAQRLSDCSQNSLNVSLLQSLYGKYYYVILRPALSEGLVAGVSAEFEIDPEEEGENDLVDGEDPGDDDGPSGDKFPEDIALSVEDPTGASEGEGTSGAKNIKDNPKTGGFISISLIVIAVLIGITLNKLSKKKQKMLKI